MQLLSSNRRQKINQLRRQVNQMQEELKKIENGGQERSSKWNIINHLREISLSSKGKDQIRNNSTQPKNLSKQNRSPSDKKSIRGCLTSRNQQKQQIEHNLSQTLKTIVNKIDNQYYMQKKNIRECSQSPTREEDKSVFYNTTMYVGKRYQYSKFGMQTEQKVKSARLKTYCFRPTDTIINPERQVSRRGIKIVKKIQKSPDNMLTENPKSNPNLYLFNTQPVFIDKRNHIKDKNKSSIVLSPSTLHMIPAKTANSQQKQFHSQKKHFERHIQQNLCSKKKKIF